MNVADEMAGVHHMHPDAFSRETILNLIRGRSVEVLLRFPIEPVGDEPEVDARLLGVGGDPEFADDRIVADDLGEGAANLHGPGVPGGDSSLSLGICGEHARIVPWQRAGV